ncbi:hypothetical protein EKO27_g10179 [Xylaria grammica]|uniref:EKC/KEOPS complex subunit GON7 n=1 Tax=Xylaria grammica TaxID=363999 RepID=A0A439CS06_9PEZI|nr:hypothetical protein EKO27_g10179 [Xylaria grammica]
MEHKGSEKMSQIIEIRGLQFVAPPPRNPSPQPPWNSPPTQPTVAAKTAYLSSLRAATTALQDQINAALTARMEQDVRDAATAAAGPGAKGAPTTTTTQGGAVIDEADEEENYGEEVPEDDDDVQAGKPRDEVSEMAYHQPAAAVAAHDKPPREWRGHATLDPKRAPARSLLPIFPSLTHSRYVSVSTPRSRNTWTTRTTSFALALAQTPIMHYRVIWKDRHDAIPQSLMADPANPFLGDDDAPVASALRAATWYAITEQEHCLCVDQLRPPQGLDDACFGHDTVRSTYAPAEIRRQVSYGKRVGDERQRGGGW